MKRALALLLLATPASAGPLPAHYAKLFVEGQVWTYDVSLTTWGEALGDIDTTKVPMSKWPRHTEKSIAVCEVTKVVTVGKATAAQVSCDKEIDRKFDVAGVYVATAKGLHRYNGLDLPATESDLADLDPPIIAARPAASTKRTKEPFVDKSFYTLTHSVRFAGGAWCDSSSTKGAPHDGTRTTCFANGGIASGGDDVGGELHDLKYRARK